MTNLDKIKQMRIEELANLFHGRECNKCAYQNNRIDCEQHSCTTGIIEWLESEVKE